MKIVNNIFQNQKHSRHFRAVIIIFFTLPNPKIMYTVPVVCLRITGEKDDGKSQKCFVILLGSPEANMPSTGTLKCTVLSPPLCHGYQKATTMTTITTHPNQSLPAPHKKCHHCLHFNTIAGMAASVVALWSWWPL